MILIVEDIPEQQVILSAIVTNSNLGPCIAVETAEQALTILDVGRVEGPAASVRAVLMDVQLPGQDGITATGQIKANPRLAPIPIIVISALDETAPLTAAFAAGAVDYIVKPVQPVQLAARLRAVLRRGTVPVPGVRRLDRRDTLDRLAGRDGMCGVLVTGCIQEWTGLCGQAGRNDAELMRDNLIDAFANGAGMADRWVHCDDQGGFTLLVSNGDVAALRLIADELCAETPWPALRFDLSIVPARGQV